jgi:hypothetical protein
MSTGKQSKMERLFIIYSINHCFKMVGPLSASQGELVTFADAA